jgi:hypothetical protein
MSNAPKTTSKPLRQTPDSAAAKLAKIKEVTEREGLSAADQLAMIYEIVGTK